MDMNIPPKTELIKLGPNAREDLDFIKGTHDENSFKYRKAIKLHVNKTVEP